MGRPRDAQQLVPGEIQIAQILSCLKRHDLRNVVWPTTDAHYTAAHYFDPELAAVKGFNLFWQFVSRAAQRRRRPGVGGGRDVRLPAGLRQVTELR
ncbi:MAG TPA: hypothetical protein VF053_19180 [Streptosporangiales bacterium]